MLMPDGLALRQGEASISISISDCYGVSSCDTPEGLDRGRLMVRVRNPLYAVQKLLSGTITGLHSALLSFRRRRFPAVCELDSFNVSVYLIPKVDEATSVLC